MMARQPARSAAQFLPAKLTLTALTEAAASCKGCDLYQHATQTVFGEGSSHAKVILLGEQQLTHEAETLGVIVRCHPLDLYRDEITTIPHITGIEIPQHVGRSVTLIGWLVTEKSVETKHGEPMEFATFEDKTALYDATLFPDVYRRCCHLLSTDSPYVVRGTVEEHFGVTTLTVHDLHCLESTRPVRHNAETPTGDCMIW